MCGEGPNGRAGSPDRAFCAARDESPWREERRMNSHALGILEFPRVLDLVADRASSVLGGARVRSLTPSGDQPWLESEHARVAAMRALVASDAGWSPEPIPDLSRALERLRIEGTTLS